MVKRTESAHAKYSTSKKVKNYQTQVNNIMRIKEVITEVAQQVLQVPAI